MRRAISSAIAASLALAGCTALRDAIAPGRSGATSAQLALAVALAAPDGATLDLATAYVRFDDTRVPLGTTRVVLDSATTSSVPLGIDLAPCLADDRARVAGERPGDVASCRVAVTLRYTIAGTLRDVVTIGPLLVTPGVTTPAPSSVTVVSRLAVRIANAAGVPLPAGPVTVVRGQTLALRALVTDSALVRPLVRAVAWSSSNAAGASVTGDGVVSALADGTHTITASLPDGLGAATATVRVVPPTVPVTLALSGTGSGTVTPGAGTPCTLVAGAGSASCTVDAPLGAPLVLTAAPGSFTSFAGFAGACTSAATTCTLTPTAAGTVTAGFTLLSFPVSVAPRAGSTWTGRVRSTDGTIDCNVFTTSTTGTCSALRPGGSTVTLTAFADTIGVFDQWGGDCAPAGFAVTCTRTVTGPVAATAGFASGLSLVVNVAGSATGVANVSVDGFARPACVLGPGPVNGPTCTYRVRPGARIVIDAVPGLGAVFSGFDAPCEEFVGSTCRFTITNATSAFVAFGAT